MKNIKMIVMDLDGTLLTREQTILPYTREVLMDYQQKGISLVLSSGRDIDSIQNIGSMLEMEQYDQNAYICLNGLEIYDMHNQLLHKEEKLTYEDAIKLDILAKKYHIDMVLFFEKCLYIMEYGHSEIINDHFMTTTKNTVDHIEDIPKANFECLKKVAFIQHSEVINSIISNLQKETAGCFELCMVEPEWIEINPLGLSKGKALYELARIKNISIDNIIAFGNGKNDIDMLKAAGIGVAMNNSFDSVKKAADDICGDCKDDGIAHYLKTLL